MSYSRPPRRSARPLSVYGYGKGKMFFRPLTRSLSLPHLVVALLSFAAACLSFGTPYHRCGILSLYSFVLHLTGLLVSVSIAGRLDVAFHNLSVNPPFFAPAFDLHNIEILRRI